MQYCQEALTWTDVGRVSCGPDGGGALCVEIGFYAVRVWYHLVAKTDLHGTVDFTSSHLRPWSFQMDA